VRIGVDGACLANERGYGRFARELLRAMVDEAPNDEFVLFLDARAADRFDMNGGNVRRVVIRQGESPTIAAAATSHRSARDMLGFSRAVWRTPLDVFFSPSVYTYFPLPPLLPAVVAIHDAIADRFPQLTLPSRRARLFWRLKVSCALWQTRLVLTVSDFAATEVSTFLRVPAKRIRVAVEAPSAIYRPSESSDAIATAAAGVGIPAGARWLTYVGGFNPHKRVDAIIHAHARLLEERAPEPIYLLLVGNAQSDVFHGEVDRLLRLIDEAGTSRFVIWTGFVADETLRHLHAGALALLLPSECEGFGLPAVEAAACGTPVIATTASPLPQLLEGGGIFIPPGDADALTDALRVLAADETLRRAYGRRALQRAQELCWRDAALSTLASLREAAV
jgi:glycosyltransferase involved in cell wall biosynthesis